MTKNAVSNQSESTGFYQRRDAWEDYLSERTDIHPTDRLIGIWIARRISADGPRNTWYQVSTIAERLGVSARTVMRGVQKLEGEGLLIVRRDSRRGVKKAVNKYELVFPWL
jgi:DNA-binding MarR family transcriptional regulator